MPAKRLLPQGPRPGDPPPSIHVRPTAQPIYPYHNLLVVDGSLYSLCWWVVLSLHSVTAAFVLCSGFVHLALSHPVAHANTTALQLSITLKRISGFSYLLIALLHLRAVAILVSRSIRARQLTMRAPPDSTETEKSPTVRDITAAHSMHRRLIAAIKAMFGADGAFGINGRFFNIGVVIRELMEIAMQSYQLWALSHSVSREWINDFAVTTVVVNCWSIPLVHVLFHTRERTRRLMHLVVDMYLDFVCAVVIPVCVMTPYLIAFDWHTGSFPLPILSNDGWLTNAVAEGLQVLITSYADLFASLLPQYSIYSCLRILKRLVVRRSVGASKSQTFHRPRVVVPLVSAVSDLTMRSHSSKYARERRGVKFVGVTVGLWGLGILILHTTAKLNTDQDPMCQLHVRPWLARKIACSVLIVDCQFFNITGSGDEIADVLDRFERPILTRVNFTSCPEFTMPSMITEFHHLSGIRVHNSSLVSWTEAAAIRRSTHPRFDSLQFRATNLSEIPPGLYHRDLTALFSIWFYDCSLDRLPEDIGDVWGHGALHHLRLQGMRIRSIPISLAKIPLTLLWITDTLIEELSDGLFPRFRLASLRLSNNSIRRLPQDIGDISSLRELQVDQTEVSTLPAWVFSWLEDHRATNALVRVSFAGSPVCDIGGELASGVAGYPRVRMNRTQNPGSPCFLADDLSVGSKNPGSFSKTRFPICVLNAMEPKKKFPPARCGFHGFICLQSSGAKRCNLSGVQPLHDQA